MSGEGRGARPVKRAQGAARQIDLILDALELSAHKHRDQRRKDPRASPYVNHPIAVARILGHDGRVHDPEVIAAALLHDTLEDTRTSAGELRRRFGPRIAAMVREVTDNKRLSKPRRKRLQIEHARSLSHGARLVKLADKIANLRDLLVSPPVGWSLARRQEYFDWAKAVVDEIRGTNPRLEREFDRVYRRRPGRN